MAVQESVRVLKGVGPQLAEKLGRLGIVDVADVLFHLTEKVGTREVFINVFHKKITSSCKYFWRSPL